MMRALTQKTIKVLKVLARGEPVLAPWCNQELYDLQWAGLAVSAAAVIPTGKLSTTKIWAITEKGKAFLRDERGGQ